MNKEIYKLFYDKDHIRLLKYKSKKVWFYIIRLIIISTHDFNYAYKVKNNYYDIINFFNDYDILENQKIDLKIYKHDKIKYTKFNEYIDFEAYFTNKNDLIKILKYEDNKNLNEFIITRSKLELINLHVSQLEKLNIDHFDFDIINYSRKFIIKFLKHDEYNFNLSPNLKIFIIINDLCNIENFKNKFGVYYTIKDGDIYENLLLMKSLISSLTIQDIENFDKSILNDYQKNNLKFLMKQIQI